MIVRIVNNDIASYWKESDTAQIIALDLFAIALGVLFEIKFELQKENFVDSATKWLAVIYQSIQEFSKAKIRIGSPEFAVCIAQLAVVSAWSAINNIVPQHTKRRFLPY